MKDALSTPDGSLDGALPARRRPAEGSARKLFEHALLLVARQHGGAPETAAAAQAELTQWRQANALHEAAAQAALRAWSATEASALRETVARPAAGSAHHARRTRRQILAAFGGLGAAVLVAGGARWFWRQPVLELALRTSHGQRIAHPLPDGSRLDLAARTAVEVAYFRDRREVRLAGGEIRCEVAHDPARPFFVNTEWGRVRVLGTVFSVSARDGRMHVAVAQGRVAVWAGQQPEDGRAPDIELGAGNAVDVGAQGLGPRAAVRPGDVGAWRQGWLAFDDTPLPEAVARWNDYLDRPMELADEPALRGLRLTGSFPLRDPATFLASLPSVLPVRVERTGSGAALIRPRR